MPGTPPPPPGIDERIAEAVANEDYELAAKLKKMKTQPPPPPPPKKGKKAPPPKGRPKWSRPQGSASTGWPVSVSADLINDAPM